MDITNLLTLAINCKASDLHLSVGLSPRIRVDGLIRQLDLPVVSEEGLLEALQLMLPTNDLRHGSKEQDAVFELAGKARLRVHVFNQYHGLAVAIRILPLEVPTFVQLQLPAVLQDFANLRQGLVLVTGSSGSGKSSSLAAMIDYINSSSCKHVITLEDPIEFVHRSKRSIINQRQIGLHTSGFEVALRSALREDPDVIVIGELRDLESIRLAISAAETGHLVLATLHSNSASKALHRLIDVFPLSERSMLRQVLSESLQAIVSQRLLPAKEGGRIPAFEVMTCTPAIRHLIREDKTPQLYSLIQTGQASGMKTMEQSLAYLKAAGIIETDPSN